MPFDPLDDSRYRNMKFLVPRAGLPKFIQDMLKKEETECWVSRDLSLHSSEQSALNIGALSESVNGFGDCSHGHIDEMETERRRREDEAGGEKG